MKKVIFISALAIAAAVSCTKSDIVDTKFNEQISFESYVGRDAMTKGSVIEKATLDDAMVYGYYLGSTGTWNADMAANLWVNGLTLPINNGVVQQLPEADVRYWANDSDKYAFFAYSPIVSGNEYYVAPASTANPTLTYEVSNDFTKHVDILRAVPVTGSKSSLNGSVNLDFKHTLSRVTVTANVNAATPFNFFVKTITLSGVFNTKGSLELANQTDWKVATDDVKEMTYNIYTNPTTPNTEASTYLTVAGTDYADVTQAGVAAPGTNYMMMIPTTFSATNKAMLKVVYCTTAAGIQSDDYTVEYPIDFAFEKGKAYKFNLAFQQAENPEIKFTVDVSEAWAEQDAYDVLGTTTTTPEE